MILTQEKEHKINYAFSYIIIFFLFLFSLVSQFFYIPLVFYFVCKSQKHSKKISLKLFFTNYSFG